MVLSPITVRPSQTLREALDTMREHDVTGLPVVEGDRPVGILTAETFASGAASISRSARS